MTPQEEMIRYQLENRNINDPDVLAAMRKIDRKLFVPEEMKHMAYEDSPLPIGKSQTISQPYIVAYMAQELQIDKSDTVLEIGSGCGYHSAVMSELADHVYSIEIIGWLADMARENLRKANIKNVTVRNDDGYQGWPDKAPFDGIVLTAAPTEIPEPLKEQLKVGGTLLAPVGIGAQRLMRLKKTAEDEFEEQTLTMVSFVPMTGAAREFAEKGGSR